MNYQNYQDLMLLTFSNTKRTLMHLFLFTNSAQREPVPKCTQSIRNCNLLSLHYNLKVYFPILSCTFVQLYSCTFHNLKKNFLAALLISQRQNWWMESLENRIYLIPHIYFACQFVCLFVTNKRQYGRTDHNKGKAYG